MKTRWGAEQAAKKYQGLKERNKLKQILFSVITEAQQVNHIYMAN